MADHLFPFKQMKSRSFLLCQLKVTVHSEFSSHHADRLCFKFYWCSCVWPSVQSINLLPTDSDVKIRDCLCLLPGGVFAWISSVVRVLPFRWFPDSNKSWLSLEPPSFGPELIWIWLSEHFHSSAFISLYLTVGPH